MAKKLPRAFKFASFSKKQKKVVTWWRDGSPYKDYDGIIADGSIRSGKTIAFIVGFIKWSTRCFEDQNFIISGRTIGTLKRNVVGPMLRILRALKITYIYNRSENYLEFGGNTYYLFGADNEASQDVVQGITAAGWFADEAALHHPDFLNQALGRLLSVEGSKFWWNCNPESPAHTVKVDFIDKAKEKRILHLHFNLDDNLTLSERAKEKARRMFSGVFFKRYILGLWVVAEGLCFSAFDEDIHVVDTLPEMVDYWVSGDLGTTNPTVFLLIGKGVDDNYYVVDEWRWDSKKNAGRVKRNPELVEELLNWEAFHGVYPQLHIFDPSAADFIAEAEEAGVYGVTDADNSVVPGIRWTDSLLHLKKLYIHRRCAGLITEIIGYMWDPKQAAKGKDEPIKLADHGCFVAGTMVETANGPVSIEDIQPGDMVWTRQGLKRVEVSRQTQQEAEVKTVVLSDGRRLTGTGNHPIFVQGQGYLRLDALRYGDILELWKTKSSYSMESPSADTPTVSVGPTSITSRRALPTNAEESGGSTKRYGNPCTDLFQRATRFITRISTLATTTLKILCVSQSASTSIPTGNGRENGHQRPKISRILKAIAQKQPSGTHQMKAESGTESTVRQPGTSGNLSKRNVLSAERHSKTSHCVRSRGSAPTPAKATTADCQAWTTKTGNVLSAEQSSQSTNTPKRRLVPVSVVQVLDEAEKQTVYNLAVADSHEYYANGILVHNCDALRYFVYTVIAKVKKLYTWT